MGIINIRIDNDLDQEFRIEVVKRYHGKKGAIRIAVEEAMKLWLKHEHLITDLKDASQLVNSFFNIFSSLIKEKKQ